MESQSKKTRINFTPERLTNVKCPPGKLRVRVYDTKVSGLSLRANVGGSKIYSWYHRLPDDNETPRKMCEITIGNFGETSLDEARKRAEEFNVTVGNKKDPTLKSATEQLTYDHLFRRYVEEYAKTRTTTWQNMIYNHERYFKRWHDKSIASIKRDRIQAWVNDIGSDHGKPTANRMFNQMRAVLSWAIRKDIISGTNPCVGVDRFRMQSRERFIMPGSEFERFAQALAEEPNQVVQDFFWMCLFTGARRANVLAMEWKQVEFELMNWRIPVTKNKESLTIPLTPAAMAVLRRRKGAEDADDRWVFPSDRKGTKTGVKSHLVSPHKAWGRILERASIEDLRIHDLRRTAGSYMAIKGVSPAIIGKALGHKSPHSTAIYARLTQDPVRQALEEAQAAMINPSELLPRKANVLKINSGKTG